MFKINLAKFFPQLKSQTQLSLAIITSLSAGILSYLAILDKVGSVGGAFGSFLVTLFGRAAFVFPLGFFITAYLLIKIQRNAKLEEGINGRLVWGIGFMLLSICGFLSIFSGVNEISSLSDKVGGGVVGFLMYPFLLDKFLGVIGSAIFLAVLFLAGFFLLSQMSFTDFITRIGQLTKNPGLIWDFIPDMFEFWKTDDMSPSLENNEPAIDPLNPRVGEKSAAKVHIPKDEPKPSVNQKSVDINGIPKQNDSKPIFTSAIKSEDGVTDLKPTGIKNLEWVWKLPPFDILKENKTHVEPGDVETNKMIIKETLAHFSISVEMGSCFVGPTVTQYTMKPTSGVRLSAIDGLSRDLALALAAPNIRIEAPIAGQSLVGIEIPNKIKSQVRLRDIIQTHKFLNYENDLAVAIGKDVSGHNLIYSLAKMPHLLVAGATGSGKSVWINGMLLSLLYRYAPSELQLVLVDMKRVELKLYEAVPHLVSKVITDAEKAVNALKWTVLEMDRRYKLLEEFGKRNIKDYNQYAQTANEDKLPFIVFVIDELGDLMMLAKSEVEPIVVRLTQMSRAVGIHLVLGTQRPDIHVVTGLIKANVPTRIAFAVASQIDSRVILDASGAEKLLGQGDGLITTPSSMHPIRFQGPNVEESEVKKCVDYLVKQAEENGLFNNLNPSVTEKQQAKLNIPGMATTRSDDEVDETFEEARRLVIQYQKASTSFLQQMMGVGYPKAAKIMFKLEEMGVVGPANGSKSRDVYATADSEDVV